MQGLLHNNLLSRAGLFGGSVGGGGGIVKQKGSVFVGGSYANISIDPVDTLKSLPRMTYFFKSTTATKISQVLYSCNFIDAETLRLTVGSPGGAEAYWEVVEFENAKRVYNGSFSGTDWAGDNGNRSKIITIDAINPDKSRLYFSYWTDYTGTALYQLFVSGDILSPTELLFKTYGAINFRVYWYVVELK